MYVQFQAEGNNAPRLRDWCETHMVLWQNHKDAVVAMIPFSLSAAAYDELYEIPIKAPNRIVSFGWIKR